MQNHYAVSASVKRQIRAALQRMVEAGRLETVPNHQSLYRLGGVIRQLSQAAGIEWPRAKPGSGLLDPRVGPLGPLLHASLFLTMHSQLRWPCCDQHSMQRVRSRSKRQEVILGVVKV